VTKFNMADHHNVISYGQHFVTVRRVLLQATAAEEICQILLYFINTNGNTFILDIHLIIQPKYKTTVAQIFTTKMYLTYHLYNRKQI